jgi:signal transduction histidine kinase
MLSAFRLLVVAVLLHYGIVALDVIEAQGRVLRQQNEELDRRRRDAEEAARRRTEVLAHASHDLRTPVYAIRLMAEVLGLTAENPSLATRVPDLVNRLQANARSLDQLMSDMLDVASIDLGHIVVQETVFSLNDLLVEQYSNLLALADAKKLRLQVEAPDPPLWLRTDRGKLARVLSNLLGNAIRFTQNGSIVISVRKTTTLVLIDVRDTGVGIAAAQLNHIFDEFAQLQNGPCDDNDGSGLGLPICRGLIAALGGAIAVESELGQGSTFTASLSALCAVPPHTARDGD